MGRTRASDKVASAMKTGGDDDVAGASKYKKLGVKALIGMATERGVVLGKDKRKPALIVQLIADDGTYHITGVI